MMTTSSGPKLPIIVLACIQLVLIILYAAVVRYDDLTGDTKNSAAAPSVDFVVNTTPVSIPASDIQAAAFGEEGDPNNQAVAKYYGFFADVHVMIVIGFGFLMTFLRKYGHSSVGINFLLTSITLQWAMLVVPFCHMMYHNHFTQIQLDITSLIGGDFAAGAVLISMGAVLGKTSPLQLSVMAVLEVVFYALNETIGVAGYEAVDMGGSMYVHTFGAYFGLMVALMLDRADAVEKRAGSRENSDRNSDLFSMIGTLFLWVFWPSFNGALASGLANSQHRVIINTVMSLCGSCTSAFVMSHWLRDGKFCMEDIQNATLAGGVAVGSSADLVILPWAALLVGVVAGAVSVSGYRFNFLGFMGLHDTAGVHNLHGVPGLIGGIVGAIAAGTVDDTVYGHSISVVYPARPGRSAGSQAGHQLAAVVTTLAFSVVGGLITGYILKRVPRQDSYFDDGVDWKKHDDGVDIEMPSASREAVNLPTIEK